MLMVNVVPKAYNWFYWFVKRHDIDFPDIDNIKQTKFI